MTYEDNNDAQPLVTAVDGEGQGIATPEPVEIQGTETATRQELNFRSLEADRDKYRSEAEAYKSQAQEQTRLVDMYHSMNYQAPQGQQQQTPGYQPQQQAPQQSQPNNGIDLSGAIDGEILQQLSGQFSSQAEQMNSQIKQQSQQLEQMQLAQHDANWKSTIEKYLPEVLQQQPWLENEIKNSPSVWKSMYHHATNNQAYFQNTVAQNQSKDAEKIVQNASKPQTLGSTGVQSNVTGKKSAFAMTDQEFLEAQQAIRNGTFSG